MHMPRYLHGVIRICIERCHGDVWFLELCLYYTRPNQQLSPTVVISSVRKTTKECNQSRQGYVCTVTPFAWAVVYASLMCVEGDGADSTTLGAGLMAWCCMMPLTTASICCMASRCRRACSCWCWCSFTRAMSRAWRRVGAGTGGSCSAGGGGHNARVGGGRFL